MFNVYLHMDDDNYFVVEWDHTKLFASFNFAIFLWLLSMLVYIVLIVSSI